MHHATNPTPRASRSGPITRRAAATLGLLAMVWALSACGGGGSSSGPADGGTSTLSTRETRSISSRHTATAYPLTIYLPPASAGPRASLPVVYLLDGESWFSTLSAQADVNGDRMIIVGVGTAGQRNRDFVPSGSCTPNGGGHVAFLDFLRQELVPYIESTFGGDPARRVLFGHSHGGSFVLYALFAQAPGQHAFKAYLASDASVSCFPFEAYGWERDYAARYRELPVRLHLSYATLGNALANQDYAAALAQRKYERLTALTQGYTGSHSGIVPQVLAEAVPFALGSSP